VCKHANHFEAQANLRGKRHVHMDGPHAPNFGVGMLPLPRFTEDRWPTEGADHPGVSLPAPAGGHPAKHLMGSRGPGAPRFRMTSGQLPRVIAPRPPHTSTQTPPVGIRGDTDACYDPGIGGFWFGGRLRQNVPTKHTHENQHIEPRLYPHYSPKNIAPNGPSSPAACCDVSAISFDLE